MRGDDMDAPIKAKALAAECLVDSCRRKPIWRDLCIVHYEQVRLPELRESGLTCSVDGCDEPPRAKRMCDRNYGRARNDVRRKAGCRGQRHAQSVRAAAANSRSSTQGEIAGGGTRGVITTTAMPRTSTRTGYATSTKFTEGVPLTSGRSMGSTRRPFTVSYVGSTYPFGRRLRAVGFRGSPRARTTPHGQEGPRRSVSASTGRRSGKTSSRPFTSGTGTVASDVDIIKVTVITHSTPTTPTTSFPGRWPRSGGWTWTTSRRSAASATAGSTTEATANGNSWTCKS